MNDLFTVFAELLNDLADDQPLWRTADNVYTVKDMRAHFKEHSDVGETYIVDTLRVARDIIRASKDKQDKQNELRDWTARYGDVRDDLIFRQARGESLSPKEESLLRLLESQLSHLMHACHSGFKSSNRN